MERPFFETAKGDSLMHKNPIWRGFCYAPDYFGAIPGTEDFEQLGGAEGLTGLIQFNARHGYERRW
jgi:hypothetical protein